jgi:hypothetical protein
MISTFAAGPTPLLDLTKGLSNLLLAGVTVQFVGYETEKFPCGSDHFVILVACANTECWPAVGSTETIIAVTTTNAKIKIPFPIMLLSTIQYCFR